MAEKTEKATPKKAARRAQKGQVAKSQDFPCRLHLYRLDAAVIMMLAISFKHCRLFHLCLRCARREYRYGQAGGRLSYSSHHGHYELQHADLDRDVIVGVLAVFLWSAPCFLMRR